MVDDDGRGRPPPRLPAFMEHFVTSQIASYGYLAVFFLMVAESACIPVPSEAIMLLGGALSSGTAVAAIAASLHMTGFHHLNVVAVGALGTAGNVVGSWIAYGVGRAGGRPLIERFGRVVRMRAHELDRAEAWFDRRGDVAVLVARVMPVIRTFISLPAGVAGMPFGRFTLFTLVGSLPWTFALALTGYAVADHWQGVAHAFQPASYAIAGLAAVAIAWWLVRRLRRPVEAGRAA